MRMIASILAVLLFASPAWAAYEVNQAGKVVWTDTVRQTTPWTVEDTVLSAVIVDGLILASVIAGCPAGQLIASAALITWGARRTDRYRSEELKADMRARAAKREANLVPGLGGVVFGNSRT